MTNQESAAQIVSIVYKPDGVEGHPADRYARYPLEQARLLANYGIEGDRKGGHPERQLNIMSAETLAQLAAQGCDTSPGALGEQIIVRGVDIDTLPPGARLRLGADAVIEVIKPRTGCNRFEHIQGVSPVLLAGRMGIMARVISSGPIQVGDSVMPLAEV